jgi:hypothetical protein
LAWLVLAACAFGQVPYDPILGICRVQLETGKEVEGVVVVTLRGDGKSWTPNGFYQTIDGREGRVSLFNGDFHTFVPKSGFVAETLWLGPWTRPYVHTYRTKTYFMQRLPEDYKASSEQDKTNDSGITLHEDTAYHRMFLLAEYVPVYKTVPPDPFPWHSWRPESQIKIPLADVAQFRLLTKPGARWLHRIAVAESTFEAKYGVHPMPEKEGIMSIVYRPGWFHRVVSDSALRSKFSSWYR